jgi:hypothetical protein
MVPSLFHALPIGVFWGLVCLAIYEIGRIVEHRLFPAMLIDLPFRLAVVIWRAYAGSSRYRAELVRGQVIDANVADAVASKADGVEWWLSRRLERLRGGRSILGKVLFEPSDVRRYAEISDRVLARLSTDRALFEALGTGEAASERGIILIAASPIVRRNLSSDEIVATLVYVCINGAPRTQKLAFYHLTGQILNSAAKSRAKALLSEFAGSGDAKQRILSALDATESPS